MQHLTTKYVNKLILTSEITKKLKKDLYVIPVNIFS